MKSRRKSSKKSRRKIKVGGADNDHKFLKVFGHDNIFKLKDDDKINLKKEFKEQFKKQHVAKGEDMYKLKPECNVISGQGHCINPNKQFFILVKAGMSDEDVLKAHTEQQKMIEEVHKNRKEILKNQKKKADFLKKEEGMATKLDYIFLFKKFLYFLYIKQITEINNQSSSLNKT